MREVPNITVIPFGFGRHRYWVSSYEFLRFGGTIDCLEMLIYLH